METQPCELCGRRVAELERHHLIPRARHRNKGNRRRFGRDEAHGRVAMLCGPCHRTLHATFAEKELERDYNTLEAIRAHEAIRKFVRWIRRRPPETGVRVRRGGGDDLRRRQQLRRERRKAKQRRREA